MARNVRRVFLENENGERIDCLLRSSFFNDLSGLGFSNSYDFLNIRDGFFYLTREQTEQQVISGMISFIDRATAYSDYRTFASWILSTNRLSIVYIPYGSDEYYIDVKPVSLSKGELDVGGFLSCELNFICVTPWYSQTNTKLSFDDSLLTGIKRYDYQYDYKYALSVTPGEITFSIDGDYDGGLRFIGYGALEDPVLTLLNTNTEEVYGILDLTGTSFEVGEALIFATTFNDSGIWKRDSDLTYTSLAEDVVIHQGTDVFFLIPRDTPLTLRLEVAGALTTGTEIEIYKYWKTR